MSGCFFFNLMFYFQLDFLYLFYDVVYEYDIWFFFSWCLFPIWEFESFGVFEIYLLGYIWALRWFIPLVMSLVFFSRIKEVWSQALKCWHRGFMESSGTQALSASRLCSLHPRWLLDCSFITLAPDGRIEEKQKKKPSLLHFKETP